MEEIRTVLDTHRASYPEFRAVLYTIETAEGRSARIVIDLLDEEDIGYPQACSNLLAALIIKGIEFTDYEVKKYAIK